MIKAVPQTVSDTVVGATAYCSMRVIGENIETESLPLPGTD